MLPTSFPKLPRLDVTAQLCKPDKYCDFRVKKVFLCISLDLSPYIILFFTFFEMGLSIRHKLMGNSIIQIIMFLSILRFHKEPKILYSVSLLVIIANIILLVVQTALYFDFWITGFQIVYLVIVKTHFTIALRSFYLNETETERLAKENAASVSNYNEVKLEDLTNVSQTNQSESDSFESDEKIRQKQGFDEEFKIEGEK